MQHRLLTISVIIFALFLSACNGIRGNGAVTTETYDVNSFNAVVLQTTGNVIITEGDTQSVVVRADRNIHRILDITVRNSQLMLGTENGTSIRDYTELTFEITVPDLEMVRVSSSGDMVVNPVESDDFDVAVSGSGTITVDSITAGDLTLNVSGSGDIQLTDSDVETIDARISGSGDIMIAGETDDASVTISGSGNFAGFDLDAQEATVRISGSGRIDILAETITGSISGSGTVRHADAESVDVNVTGSGNVRER